MSATTVVASRARTDGGRVERTRGDLERVARGRLRSARILRWVERDIARLGGAGQHRRQQGHGGRVQPDPRQQVGRVPALAVVAIGRALADERLATDLRLVEPVVRLRPWLRAVDHLHPEAVARGESPLDEGAHGVAFGEAEALAAVGRVGDLDEGATRTSGDGARLDDLELDAAATFGKRASEDLGRRGRQFHWRRAIDTGRQGERAHGDERRRDGSPCGYDRGEQEWEEDQ
jgi:hypothetical protein